MPRPVCVRCSREMDQAITGAVVEFHAVAVGGPYQSWSSDVFGCPDCGALVVVRYGDKPLWEHFQDAEAPDPFMIVPEHRAMPRLDDVRSCPECGERPLGLDPIAKKAMCKNSHEWMLA